METFPNDIIVLLAITHLSKQPPLQPNATLNCIYLLLVLLQISTRVCVLLDYRSVSQRL